MRTRQGTLVSIGIAVATMLVSGCTQSTDKLTEQLSVTAAGTKPYAYSNKDKDCLARAMFFESRRSSREGLVAVGTVVMNRLQSGQYGETVCGVVGQKGQFAPGVLSRSMDSSALPDVQAAADAVLKGERHPEVKDALFFHTAGLKFPYKNMHYVLVAGGNAFYEKRSRHRLPEKEAPAEPTVAVASARSLPGVADLGSAPRPTFASTASDPAGPTDASVLSYEASPEAVDAIGAMIASQDRPLE